MHKKKFQQLIWSYYKSNRRDLPWRNTTNPYYIVVSEIMLQQTQVSRVLVKYAEFIKKFPDFKTLNAVSIAEVLQVWSGMGYNRRALYLKQIAGIVIEKYNGQLPSEPKLLDEFPGIAAATANSIATFAFNYPGIFIETNIRRVFIHYFFKDAEEVFDKEIYPLVEEMVDKENPRDWYYALMDYGVKLVKELENPNRRSKHYSIQSKFEGSDRQMRGAVLKLLLQKPQPKEALFALYENDKERLVRSLKALQKEGFIMEKQGSYLINKV